MSPIKALAAMFKKSLTTLTTQALSRLSARTNIDNGSIRTAILEIYVYSSKPFGSTKDFKQLTRFCYAVAEDLEESGTGSVLELSFPMRSYTVEIACADPNLGMETLIVVRIQLDDIDSGIEELGYSFQSFDFLTEGLNDRPRPMFYMKTDDGKSVGMTWDGSDLKFA